MKYFDWDNKKNEKLKAERGISFEEVANAIVEGHLLTTIDHPNIKKYSKQRIFIVEFDEYAYAVPYVEDSEKLFLKTIYPSRKYTYKYIEKGVL